MNSISNSEVSKAAATTQLVSARFKPHGESYLRLSGAQEQTRQEVLSKIRDGRYQLSTRPCQLCGSSDAITIAQRDRYSLPVETSVCKTCSLLSTNPVMRDVDYADFYQNHYTSLYDGFQYSTDEFFENQRAAGKRLHDTVKQHVDLNRKTVAEVGCAAGGILSYFRQFCANVVGCDYGTRFMEAGVAKGMKLKVGGIAVLRDEKPDAIIYSHVLEHILDINAELRQVHDILPSDGLLIIDVPGIYNIESAYEADFLKYLQNAHLFHFTSDTLKGIMAANGFETIHVDERCIGIFRKTADIKPAFSSGQHQKITSYLQRMEGKYLLVRVQKFPRKAAVKILKSLGLHDAVRNMYRKLAPR